MLVVRGKTAVNVEACEIIQYQDCDFDKKIIFGNKLQLKTERAAQIFEEIIEAYERGAKVYKIEE